MSGDTCLNDCPDTAWCTGCAACPCVQACDPGCPVNARPVHQIITGLPPGPHFVHCYIYVGQHCSCGGNYRGNQPGPTIRGLANIPTTEETS